MIKNLKHLYLFNDKRISVKNLLIHKTSKRAWNSILRSIRTSMITDINNNRIKWVAMHSTDRAFPAKEFKDLLKANLSTGLTAFLTTSIQPCNI